MTAPHLSATERLGRLIAHCISDSLQPNVVEKAAICMLDALGLAIAARDERTAAAMRIATARVIDTPNAAPDPRLAGSPQTNC